jgi:hypothetical protein
MKKTVFILLCLLLYSSTVSAQRKELGIKFGLHLFQLSGVGTVGKYYVFNDNYANMDGSHIGIYYRQYDKKNRFYLQAELQYTINLESASIINTNPEQYYEVYAPGDTSFHTEWSVSITGRTYRRLEIPLAGGISLLRPFKWLNLRTYAGLVPSYLFRDAHDSYYPAQNRIMYDLHYNTYHRWAVDYLLGFGLDIWHITLDARYTGGITRLSTETKYEGKAYSFRQKSNALFFSLGYKFNLKERKK